MLIVPLELPLYPYNSSIFTLSDTPQLLLGFTKWGQFANSRPVRLVRSHDVHTGKLVPVASGQLALYALVTEIDGDFIQYIIQFDSLNHGLIVFACQTNSSDSVWTKCVIY